ncbi:MAG: hypothetical protein ACFB2W_11665 [Leptolyngbyaceae cyanobacterium]
MMAVDVGREAQQAITLIKSFCLELNSYSPESQVLHWLNHYRAPWIRDAIIEAVYQGRYKLISVDHILSIWQRRGQPVRHFTSGFEQAIASHIGSPIHLSTSSLAAPATAAARHRADNASQPATASQLGQNESSFSDSSDMSGAFIESFPVAPINTLVEVYQAGQLHRSTQYPSPNSFEHFSSSRFELPNPSKRRNQTLTPLRLPVMSAPSPIQPFRPTPRRRLSE